MKVDGFQIKIHGLFAMIIALAVFLAAYKVGQQGMLDNMPLFRRSGQ